MGKKKGNKVSSGTTITAGNNNSAAFATPKTSLSAPPPNDALIAVIEFHHMLIGPTHKKEAAALGAAASHGICGFIFMGGPSAAIVQASSLDDLRAWLADCKKAGKEGHVAFWKVNDDGIPMNSKLKIMPYATGKDTKMDTAAYQETLATVNIPFPLPPCAPLLLC